MSEFDHKAREWDNDPMHWERARAVADAFLRLVPLQPGMTALEFGAGTGILSFALADHFREITMMDNSAEMVRVMEDKVHDTGRKNLKPLFFDLQHAPYPESRFDVVFNQMVMHHVQDIHGMLERFREILFPGGFLVIADLCPEDGTFHKPGFTGHFGFDPQELQRSVAEGWIHDLGNGKVLCGQKKYRRTGKGVSGVYHGISETIFGPRRTEGGAFGVRPPAGERGKREKGVRNIPQRHRNGHPRRNHDGAGQVAAGGHSLRHRQALYAEDPESLLQSPGVVSGERILNRAIFCTT